MPRPSTPTASAASAQSREGQAPVRPERLPRGRAREGVDFTIGPRVLQAAVRHAHERKPGEPVFRPLRIYSLDPSASVADGAQAVVNVPYEPLESTPHGLRGVNLEIVDDDPAAADRTVPVRLDEPFLLMRQGHDPSPEDRAFRQQMAYAVCSTTYAAFHQALGREITWGFARDGNDETGSRLRIRPCVAHLANAYYDPRHGELRFGTFEAASTVTGRNVPGGTISLALSHDVVVHEMSHAMLDGLRSHFLYPSNLDVLAFHEGFADLIALFQRFTYREVVGRAVRASRGRLTTARLLTGIAVQFAQAMNATGALRTAVGDKDGREERPYESTTEPHARGEILVWAVFSAFNRVYERRTAHLLRLASGGTGVLPDGEIPELLAAQLTERASRIASHFLAICIRAIDYCPPVDLTFGEFLRAVITADHDLVPHDDWSYREAWIDAFAARRIYPAGVPSLSEQALRWKSPGQAVPPERELSFAELRFDGEPGRIAGEREMRRQAEAFGQLAADPLYRAEFGLAGLDDPGLDGDKISLPVVESVRSLRRVGPSGQVVFDLVAEITQRRSVRATEKESGFDFFGGATVVLGPRGDVRYVIRKSVLDDARIEAQRRFINGTGKAFFARGPRGMSVPQANLLLQLHDITRPQLRSSAGTRALMRGMSGTEATAAQRYLLQQDEQRSWVPLLKACLQACMDGAPELGKSDTYDAPTKQAVERLQIEEGAGVDGIVGPATWTIVGRRLRDRRVKPPSTDSTPKWIAGLLNNNPAAATLKGVDIDGVIDMTEYTFGALSPGQRNGLTTLLRAIAADEDVTDLRWGAYMLATVKHECANTWQPIEEFGKGAGRAYGEAVRVLDEAGREVRNCYYGRGFVQLTWRENYLAMGRRIGLERALEIHPEQALEPLVAYRIMSEGMRKGIFTGRALARYINADGADYQNARRIINGTDRAELVAGYARRFETMLLAYTGLTSSSKA